MLKVVTFAVATILYLIRCAFTKIANEARTFSDDLLTIVCWAAQRPASSLLATSCLVMSFLAAVLFASSAALCARTRLVLPTHGLPPFIAANAPPLLLQVLNVYVVRPPEEPDEILKRSITSSFYGVFF